jgi:Amt family ammonium transporter
MITGMLVFFMNLGFACVESGFARAKNCVNILSKNFIVFAATTIGFWLIGWGIMFGHGSPWYGSEGVRMVSGADNSPATSTLASLIKSDIKDKYDIRRRQEEIREAGRRD